MVERFPRNKNHQAKYRVIPGKPGSSTDRLRSGGVNKLDPGSSLLKTTTRPQSNRTLYNSNPRSSAPLSAYICVNPLDPGSIAQGWQSPFATETGGLFQTGNSVASAEQTSAALILSA